ncbi:MAG: replication protein RepA, partial [bacterium]
GGRWGTMPRLKDQMIRLFSSMITTSAEMSDIEGPRGRRGRNIMVADDYTLWWDPQRSHQAALWQSMVKLSDPFFQQIVDRPVPIDMRAIKALKKSPLALDLYAWATYRVSYLARPTNIPWGTLMLQFGAGYPDTPQGRRDFRKHFLSALRKVATAYPTLRAQEDEKGLSLRPSPPHVTRLSSLRLCG